jgi:glycosyltransferase involved in cell wall biosynthesis
MLGHRLKLFDQLNAESFQLCGVTTASQQSAKSMHSEPTVSVIVPCRNERDYIESCVRSILAQEPPPGGFEVIVADGISVEGTRSILKKLAKKDYRLRVVDNPERIIPAGLNSAIRGARGSIIVRMDAHTEYSSDYIRQCFDVLHETGADNVGGPWIAEGKDLIGRAIAAAFQSAFAVGGARGHNPDYEGFVDTVYLGCWRREVFDRIGLFDEGMVRSEDDELSLRLTRAGGKIWQSPRIKSRYHTRESLVSLLRQQVQYGYWKVRVIQKHRIPASVRHLVPGCFVLSLIFLGLAAPWSRVALWGWIGLGGLYLLCNLAASIVTAWRTDWTLFPLLPFVFACYHFGYGYGFVRGILDFVILHREPAHAYTKLTRTSTIDSA